MGEEQRVDKKNIGRCDEHHMKSRVGGWKARLQNLRLENCQGTKTYLNTVSVMTRK